MKTAIYPGSFDPMTNGHLDVLERAARAFDEVVVAVLNNPSKQPLFTVEERVRLIREVVADYPNVTVDHFQGLLVDYARLRQADAVVRGLREVGDFENELKMAQMNRHLNPDLVTVFIPTASQYAFVSSSLVKEVAAHGGDIGALVPSPVAAALTAKFGV
jgi:pantetheine-phosphate adenylyltransferase